MPRVHSPLVTYEFLLKTCDLLLTRVNVHSYVPGVTLEEGKALLHREGAFLEVKLIKNSLALNYWKPDPVGWLNKKKKNRKPHSSTVFPMHMLLIFILYMIFILNP